MIETIVLVTGGFDPIHSGHIALFKAAKELEPDVKLAVGVNTNEWLERKKGRFFMGANERVCIIKELRCVDVVIEFRDNDDTANDAIDMALQVYDRVIFANGGDRGDTNTPEYDKYKDNERVVFKWGVGGKDKKNSSSLLLNNWSSYKPSYYQ